jgi:predicted transcriptional regulator
MKTAALPAVRVEPELRERIEVVLREGESLSAFVEAAVRDSIQRRVDQAEFVARGLRSIDAAKAGEPTVSVAQVMRKLEARLARARKQAAAAK